MWIEYYVSSKINKKNANKSKKKLIKVSKDIAIVISILSYFEFNK